MMMMVVVVMLMVVIMMMRGVELMMVPLLRWMAMMLFVLMIIR